MNGNEPATKADLLALESRMEARFDGKLSALEARSTGNWIRLSSGCWTAWGR